MANLRGLTGKEVFGFYEKFRFSFPERMSCTDREALFIGSCPKLFKIYKELKRQNEIIFEAEKERNTLELERNDLKGLARFTKKGELQSKIDRKNEEIDILKIGLSGIAKRYGYQNVQEFYRTYHKSHSAYADYQEKISKWEENYGNKSTNDSVQKRIQNYQNAVSERQSENITKKKDRGAR